MSLPLLVKSLRTGEFVALAFDESKHPRGAKGTHEGGKFVAAQQASEKALKASQRVYKYNWRESVPKESHEAVEHASKKQHKKAAELHQKLADKYHAMGSSNRQISYTMRQHYARAGKAHREAEKAHKAIFEKPKPDYSKGITHENTTIYQGTIMHAGQKVGTIEHHLKHGYHPVYHLKLNTGHDEMIEMDAHKDMPSLAKYVHEKLKS